MSTPAPVSRRFLFGFLAVAALSGGLAGLIGAYLWQASWQLVPDVVNTPVSHAPIVVLRRNPIALSSRPYALKIDSGDPLKPEKSELTIDLEFEPDAGATKLLIGNTKDRVDAKEVLATSSVARFKDIRDLEHEVLVRTPAALVVEYVSLSEFKLSVKQGGATNSFKLDATRGESLAGRAADLATRSLADNDGYRVTEVTVDMLKRKAVFYVFHK